MTDPSQYFSYDPITGVVSRTVKRGRGSVGPVGTVNVQGYLVVNFSGQVITLHRLAWRIHHGVYPDGMLDHINGDKTDNRIENLREANHSQNGANQKKVCGLSKFKGVALHRQTGKWRAYISSGVNLPTRHLGLFSDEIEAAKAYDAAAISLWGEYAATNFQKAIENA